MKFMLYGVYDYEVPIIKEWAQINDIQVNTTADSLNVQTADEAAGYDGISTLQTQVIGNEVFQKLSKLNISALSIRETNVDKVDLVAAKQNNVLVANLNDYANESTAEFSVMLALYLTKKIGFINTNQSDQLVGNLLSDLTVGVVGTGEIGRQAVQLFANFGAKVLAYDKYGVDDFENVEYDYDLDELLKQSDVVDLHLDPSGDAYHIINENRLELMKPTGILINTSSSSLINTNDLVYALQNDQIGGAGIDATRGIDANTQATLSKMPNVLLTPNMTVNNVETLKKAIDTSLDSLKEIMQTGTSANLIN